MKVIKFKIENNSDKMQNVELMNPKNNSNIVLSYELSEVDYFKGIVLKSINNIVCHKSFEGGRIFISGIPVYITEWIDFHQATHDEVAIKLLLNNVDSIYFKLNPTCEIEVTMAVNEELKKQLEISAF